MDNIHPTSADIAKWYLRDLEVTQSLAVGTHLLECERCFRKVELMEQASDVVACGALPDASVVPQLLLYETAVKHAGPSTSTETLIEVKRPVVEEEPVGCLSKEHVVIPSGTNWNESLQSKVERILSDSSMCIYVATDFSGHGEPLRVVMAKPSQPKVYHNYALQKYVPFAHSLQHTNCFFELASELLCMLGAIRTVWLVCIDNASTRNGSTARQECHVDVSRAFRNIVADGGGWTDPLLVSPVLRHAVSSNEYSMNEIIWTKSDDKLTGGRISCDNLMHVIASSVSPQTATPVAWSRYDYATAHIYRTDVHSPITKDAEPLFAVPNANKMSSHVYAACDTARIAGKTLLHMGATEDPGTVHVVGSGAQQSCDRVSPGVGDGRRNDTPQHVILPTER